MKKHVKKLRTLMYKNDEIKIEIELQERENKYKKWK